MAWTTVSAPFGEAGGYIGGLCWVDDGDTLAEFLGTGQNVDGTKAATKSVDGVSWEHLVTPFDADGIINYASAGNMLRIDALGLTLMNGTIANVGKSATSPDHSTWTVLDHALGVFGCKQSTGLVMATATLGLKTLAMTSDGGASLTYIDSPFNTGGGIYFAGAVSIAYSESQTRWLAVGSNNAIASMAYYTDDDGATWHQAIADDYFVNVSSCYRDEVRGRWYVLGGVDGANSVLVSDDEMATWNGLSTPFEGDAHHGGQAEQVLNVGGDKMVMTGQDFLTGSRLAKSFDRGDTWEVDAVPAGMTEPDCIAYSPTLDLAVLGGT